MTIIGDSSFDPEALAAMDRALTRVCGALGLADSDDPLASYVARSIVATAQRGVRAEALADAVMQQLEDESVIGSAGEVFVPTRAAIISRTPAGYRTAASRRLAQAVAG